MITLQAASRLWPALCLMVASWACSSNTSTGLDTGSDQTEIDTVADQTPTDTVPQDSAVDDGTDADDSTMNTDSAADVVDASDLINDGFDSDDSDFDSDADIEDPELVCPAGKDTPAWVTYVPGAVPTLMASCGTYFAHIQFRSPGVIRVRYSESDLGDHFSYAVVAGTVPVPGLSYGPDKDGSLVMCSKDWTAVLEKDTCRFKLLNGEGQSLVDTGANGGHKSVVEVFDGQSVQANQLVLESPQDERFYGFGEKTGPLNKRGRSMVFWNSDTPAYGPEHDPLYQSIPFFISRKPSGVHGVFVDNSHAMRFDMAKSNPGEVRLTAFGGDLDVFYFTGPGFGEVLEQYTWLTGRMELPPRWTLGYHQCRWSYTPASKVEEICQQFRSRQIPADGIWLDIDYMDSFKSWTFHPTSFSDPMGLVDSVEALGFKVTAIIDPGLKKDETWSVYQEGLSGDHFLRDPDGEVYVGVVWPGDSVFPDFSRPQTRDWWASLVPNLVNAGVRGIWLDMNEPASFKEEYKWTVPNTLIANGDGNTTTMSEIHNVYALLEAWSTYDGFRTAVPYRRPFILTRAGFAGIQRYSAVWTGDAASSWTGLQQQLPMLMNLGLSGVAFVGSDVGGWQGGTTPELYARWVAVGALSPFFRSHVQNVAPNQEPWEFGVEVEDISRIHISERYRLLPYWYSLVRQAANTGQPVLRPLVYEFNEDEVADLSDQAMIGPWIMACPVIQEGSSSRTCVLPPGKWLEYHSSSLKTGPGTVTTGVTWQALPMYLRQGAIIPKAPLMQWSDEKPLSPLFLDLFPSEQETSFEFYEDSGDGYSYLTNSYRSVTYILHRTEDGAILKAAEAEGSWNSPARMAVARFRPVDETDVTVKLDGATLNAAAGVEDLIGGSTGYFSDPADRSLWVAFPDHAPFELQVSYGPGPDTDVPLVPVTFEVEVPQGTPTTSPINLALSASDWQQIPMTWVGSNTARLTVELPRGEWFYYKYTRGDWSTVEKWAGCLDASNRYGFGQANPVREDKVEAWADWCL